MDIKKEKSSRGSGSHEEAQSLGLPSKRSEVHSDQPTNPPQFRISSSSSIMIKYATQHSSLYEPTLLVQDYNVISLMLQTRQS